MDHSSISDSFPIQHHHFSFTLRTVSSSESYFYILFFWCYFDFFSLHEHSFYLTAVDVRDKTLSEAFKCFSFYLWSDSLKKGSCGTNYMKQMCPGNHFAFCRWCYSRYCFKFTMSHYRNVTSCFSFVGLLLEYNCKYFKVKGLLRNGQTFIVTISN